MPDQAIADEQRNGQPSLDSTPAVGLLLKCSNRAETSGDDDRLAPLDHLAGRIVGPPPIEAVSEQFARAFGNPWPPTITISLPSSCCTLALR